MKVLQGIPINKGIYIGNLSYYDLLQNSDYKNDLEIIVADELLPKEVIRLSKQNIAAFVLKNCSPTSHTSIMTRTMNLPAIYGIEVSNSWHNKLAIIDGYTGTVILEPDVKTVEQYISQKKQLEETEQILFETYRGKETETKNGKKVRLYANINRISDLQKVLDNDAEGIGVFKTEFVYLESDKFPTEEEQFDIYKSVVEAMKGKKVVLRTIDIGVDKKPSYFDLADEENPALGYRAIRICLDQTEIFITQLRAMLRASAYGSVSILYPMIISTEEVHQIKRIVKGVMEDLDKECIPYDKNIEQGIMIETPAAVVISDKLAEIVDFFSIGTNDLTQYFLAVDRQNTNIEYMVDPYHPAILWALKTVAQSANNAGIWVSISGELGSDISMLSTFLDYGINALAVAPSKILQIRKCICELE